VKPYYQDDAVTILNADCREAMRGMDAESVDSIVTDPPYGLSFMGKGWDHGVPGVEFWTEAMRVAKPGAHLLAFGGTRTFHRLACAIEDAGWEIRDTVMWVYGSGFPKSLDVSKAIDKAASAVREVVSANPNNRPAKTHGGAGFDKLGSGPATIDITAPATDAARQWSGWGTALKPAWEPVIVARKPLDGTVAANVLKWGVGGINVDGCRVGMESTIRPATGKGYEGGWKALETSGSTQGRWPANLIHDGSEEVVGLFPQTGKSQGGRSGHTAAYCGGFKQEHYGDEKPGFGDTGSAARFFYCAKASKADRDEGCDGMEERASSSMSGRRTCDDVDWKADNDVTGRFVTQRRNHHPTVKPTALMRYLCRLVTPPGWLILDPFMGSGSTGKGAILEGFRFIGIDREPDYCAISEARLKHAIAQRSQQQGGATRQGVLSFTPPPPTKVGSIARCTPEKPVPPLPQQVEPQPRPADAMAECVDKACQWRRAKR
jgi:site-specific DNA-methyltransferase (adenine-specific)